MRWVLFIWIFYIFICTFITPLFDDLSGFHYPWERERERENITKTPWRTMTNGSLDNVQNIYAFSNIQESILVMGRKKNIHMDYYDQTNNCYPTNKRNALNCSIPKFLLKSKFLTLVIPPCTMSKETEQINVNRILSSMKLHQS